MRTWSLDVRAAVRSLARTPLATLAAILCLGIGLGVTVGVFALGNAVLVQAPPGVRASPRLVTLSPKPIAIPGLEGTFAQPLSTAEFRWYEEQLRPVLTLAAFQNLQVDFQVPTQPAQRALAQAISESYFDVLGLRPALGRFVARDHFEGDPEREVILGFDFWRDALGADPGVIGREVSLNGERLRVAAVAERGFMGVLHGERTQLWLSLEAAARLLPTSPGSAADDSERSWIIGLVGLLSPEISMAQAKAKLEQAEAVSMSSLGQPLGLLVDPGVGLRPGASAELRRRLLLIGLASFILWLTACANVGGIVLLRAFRDSHDVDLRRALGVSSLRLIWQSSLQAVLVGIAGGVVALLIVAAAFVIAGDVYLGPLIPSLPLPNLGAKVFLFTAFAGLLTSFFVSLAPATWAFRLPGDRVLRTRGAVSSSPSHFPAQRLFVVGQSTTAFVLLCGAISLATTLERLQSVDPGFEAREIAIVDLNLEPLRMSEIEATDFFHDILRRARQLSHGQAALSRVVPFDPKSAVRGKIAAVELEPSRGSAVSWVPYNSVSPGYFELLGIRTLTGRDFSNQDTADHQRVVIINRAMAQTLWPDESAVGRRLLIGGQPHEVVGVVADVLHRKLDVQAEPGFYVPLAQSSSEPSLTLHVRASAADSPALAALRREVQVLEPRLAFTPAEELSSLVAKGLAPQRQLATLVSIYGLAALLISALGTYSLLSFHVKSRSQEFGIRLSLGAKPALLVRSIIARGAALTAAGLLIGIGLVAAMQPVLVHFLFGVRPLELRVLAAACALIFAAGLAASLGPARAAARLDPVATLRQA